MWKEHSGPQSPASFSDTEEAANKITASKSYGNEHYWLPMANLSWEVAVVFNIPASQRRAWAAQ